MKIKLRIWEIFRVDISEAMKEYKKSQEELRIAEDLNSQANETSKGLEREIKKNNFAEMLMKVFTKNA